MHGRIRKLRLSPCCYRRGTPELVLHQALILRSRQSHNQMRLVCVPLFLLAVRVLMFLARICRCSLVHRLANQCRNHPGPDQQGLPCARQLYQLLADLSATKHRCLHRSLHLRRHYFSTIMEGLKTSAECWFRRELWLAHLSMTQ